MRLPTLLLLAVLAPAACDSADDAPPSARAPIPAGGDTTLRVAGPTLVALFPAVTEKELEADEEGLASTVDDFGHHLSEATPVLLDAGVTVHNVPGRRARLVAGDPPRPLAGINNEKPRYVLIEPGRDPYVLEGVQTDADLLHAAAVYFRLPALQSHAR
jgi:hypothetical protein